MSNDLNRGSRVYDPVTTSRPSTTPDDLVVRCRDCNRFYGKCRPHMRTMCHDTRIVYTDGACSNNGYSGAVAGIGIAFGTDKEQQFSIPVNNHLDPEEPRTSQRAELLAALHGLRKVFLSHQKVTVNRCKEQANRHSHPSPTIIITTDSQYVVQGLTKWLPTWKAHGMRKANGERPANLDLFCKLNAEVRRRERKGWIIKFWHISRSYNTIADQLAKEAARVVADL